MRFKATHRRRLLLCLSLLAALWARPAFGHYLWVDGSGESYRVNRGHTLETLHPYPPAAVTSIQALDADGAELPVERVNEKDRVLFRTARPPALAAVRCDWGGRVHTTRGKKLMTRREAEEKGYKVLESFSSLQTSKTVFRDGPVVSTPLGMPFEFVPVKSPFGLSRDEPLALKLFFRGAPLEDAVVFWGAGRQTRTDAEGIARIPLPRKPGRHMIAARHTAPAEGRDTDSDHDQYMTFFVFDVK
jgi:nickel transport protein